MSNEFLVALIAGGSAILASVGAQIIGAVVTANQESRRLDYEKERDSKAAEAAEKAKFEDLKRQAFIRYTQSVLTIHAFFSDIEKASLRAILSRRWQKRFFESYETYSQVIVEIRVLAPDVRSTTFPVGEAIDAAYAAVRKRRPSDVDANEIYERLQVAVADMRRSIGVPDLAPESTTIAAAGLPSDTDRAR